MKSSFPLIGVLLGATLICSCEPTPRTAVPAKDSEKKKVVQVTEAQPEPTPAPEPAPTPEPVVVPTPEPVVVPEPEPVVVPEPDPEPEPEPAPEPEPVVQTDADLLQENPTRALLRVRSSQQDYTILRPWQKDNVNNMELMGVYLGDGLVLTAGQAAKSATYLELSLPNSAKTVPAKVVSYDPDIQLALISVLNEKDASIFADRIALPLGDALRIGDKAEYWGSISGTDPLRIPVNTKAGTTTDLMPRLMLQSPQSLPKEETFGYPIVRDGALVALCAGFNKDQQSFIAINGELIKRFIESEHRTAHSVPTLGISIAPVDDPVMSRYLQLAAGEAGVYLSEVSTIGAAQRAGLQKEDVILAINDYDIDNQGMVQHPLYGRIDVRALIRSLLPLGESLTMRIRRKGEAMRVEVPLDREASDKQLIPDMQVGEIPRYLIHGGLLFQPLSSTYLLALQNAANGTLPEEFLTLSAREDELLEKSYEELTALTFVIPSPAVLAYEKLAYCLVEQVNGKKVHNFEELARLLDEPTADGITSIGLNKPPYTIYLKQKDAQVSNDIIRRSAIPRLRQMNRYEQSTPTP